MRTVHEDPGSSAGVFLKEPKRKAGCQPGARGSRSRGIEVVRGSTRRTQRGAQLTLRYQSGWPCGNRGPAGGAPRSAPAAGARPGALLRATAGFKSEANKSQTAAPGGRMTSKLKSLKPARRHCSWRVCLTKLSEWNGGSTRLPSEQVALQPPGGAGGERDRRVLGTAVPRARSAGGIHTGACGERGFVHQPSRPESQVPSKAGWVPRAERDRGQSRIPFQSTGSEVPEDSSLEPHPGGLLGSSGEV